MLGVSRSIGEQPFAPRFYRRNRHASVGLAERLYGFCCGLKPAWRSKQKNPFRYRASLYDCQDCALKAKCCPNTPIRKIERSPFEAARDVAREMAKTDAYQQSRKDRKKVEMLFAHLKRILKLDRLRLRGPNGAQDELLLAATAQNLRRMAKWLSPALPKPMLASA
jgi:hypothetical protein